MATKKSATHLQVILLGEKLKEVCSTIDGMAVYKEGWDDAKVVAAVDPTLSKASAGSLRRAMFGDLRMGRPAEPDLKSLLKRIEALEAWAAARPVQPFKKGTGE